MPAREEFTLAGIFSFFYSKSFLRFMQRNSSG